jgi:hypothetical protein
MQRSAGQVKEHHGGVPFDERSSRHQRLNTRIVRVWRRKRRGEDGDVEEE